MTDLSRFDVSAAQLASYCAYDARRRARVEAARQRRVETAWDAAKRAAMFLRERYGATRVVVYGSLARGSFGLYSG